MLFELQTSPGVENYSFDFDLGGAQYNLRMRYNASDASFYCDILDGDGARVRSGIRMVVNYPLWFSWGIGKPQGHLIAYAADDTIEVANLENLGTDVKLLWSDGLP